ncbi:cytochrome P450 [Croceicoccus bisphenolivorans]|uniref:cytochrome P450 n=1 Tax=Croceicoccus bisphenolivorans TaxID=1783232 RepID=UPI00082BED08|nr:cytochrome P450 [Croceicoccus bisphenolivorans]
MVDQEQSAKAIPPETSMNPSEFASIDECYEAYEELRKCPVQHADAMGGFYWVTRYGEVASAVRDGKTFSSSLKGVLLPADPDAPRIFALEQEAPEHMAAKRLYMEAFSPKALVALEPRLVAIANELIDKFAAKGECDLIADFAHPLPVLGVCSAIGVKHVSVERIKTVSGEFGKSPERRQEVIMELGGLVLEELLRRRAEPSDDYLSKIANAELNGRKLDDGELARFMVGFFTAGHETTTSTLGSLLFHSLKRPDLIKRMLEDKAFLSAAIEEATRLNPPFHAFHRTTATETEIGGLTVPQDATVRLCYASANRDPEVYDRPDEFDPDRPAKPHFGFGGGRHFCAGAPLARLEMATAFRVLLSRLSDIRLSSDEMEYNYKDGVFATPVSLKATFTPT